MYFFIIFICFKIKLRIYKLRGIGPVGPVFARPAFIMGNSYITVMFVYRKSRTDGLYLL